MQAHSLETLTAVHRNLVRIYNQVHALGGCSRERGSQLLGDTDPVLALWEVSDASERMARVREQLGAYVDSYVWTASPPVPPPSLDDLLDDSTRPLGAIAGQVYAMYYEAMRAYVLADDNYNRYSLWMRSFVFGPQPLITAKTCFGPVASQLSPYLSPDETTALGRARAELESYLAALAQSILCIWAPVPPAPPPTVPQLLQKIGYAHERSL